MNKFIYTFVLFFAYLSWAMATHIVGGQMTYTCLGNNEYHIKLDVYRDCGCVNCADFDATAPIGIYLGTSLYSTQYISPNFDNIEDIPPPVSPCIVQPDVCVERLSYEFDIFLPPSTLPYTILYQRCCRAETANNIDIDQVGATYTIDITPEAQAVCNNSPTFEEVPPTAICVGIPLSYDHHAEDVDGDSLVYFFCPLIEGGGPAGTPGNPGSSAGCNGTQPDPPCPPPFNTIDYVSPLYSNTNPMGGSPAIVIDSLTGFITGTPTLLGIYVIGVCVAEYRGDTLLSLSQRECQFDVIQCQSAMNAVVASDLVVGNQFSFLNCGDSINFDNNSTILSGVSSFSWQIVGPLNDTLSFLGANPVAPLWDLGVPAPNLGQYNAILILNPDQPWCSDTAYITVEVVEEPTANFSFAYDTCVVGPVAFTDLTTEGDATITAWNWQYGDSNSGNTQNPSHQYVDAGLIPVTLTATDANGCTDDTTSIISWYPVPPTIIIVPDITLGCAPQEVFFENLSSPLNNDYTLDWDFGDNTTGSGVSPTHTYLIGGVFDVSVHITSPEGCETDSTFEGLVTVEIPPTANYTVTFDSCVAGPIQFTDLCTAGSNPLTQWTWTYGNTETSNLQTHSYNYPEPGNYVIRLLIEDSFGCRDSMEKSIAWFPAPPFAEIDFTTPSGCAPSQVSFSNNSWPFTADYDIAWTFGNSLGSAAFEPSTTYPLSGFYDVSMTITTPIGCVLDTLLTDWVHILQGPIAEIGLTYDTCLAGPIIFDNVGPLGDTSLAQWQWDLGAGFTNSIDSFSFQYPTPGDYDLSLIVFDAIGCTDTTTSSISWYPVPNPFVINNNNLNGCAPQTILFNNLGTPIDSNYVLFWNFGNDQTAFGDSVSATYLEGGFYDVSLAIQSPNGCLVDSIFESYIELRKRPDGSFIFSPDSVNQFDPEVTFTNTTVDPTNLWWWDFDGEGVSYLENPVFTFQDTGFQQVTLIVTHVNGCRDTVINFVDVVPDLTYFLPNAFSPNEDGENEGFLGKGQMEYLYNFNLEIWDRWGEKVFETDNPNAYWNGKMNGEGRACEQGLYYYKVRFEKARGKKIAYTGQLTLVR